MCLVSVIIPTFNRSKDIVAAIESVLSQTYEKLEVIVVDDGSDDNTFDVVNQFRSCIRYLYKKNGGVSSARNLGMSVANGLFFAFLDSDDRWLPQKVEHQINFIYQNKNIDMVLCDCLFVNSSGIQIGHTNRRSKLKSNGKILNDVLMCPSLIPSSVLFRRRIYEEIGGFDESLSTAEDLDFHLRVAEKYEIGLIEEKLVECMRGNPGLSESPGTYDDHVKVFERFIDKNQHSIPNKLKKKSLFQVYLNAANGKFWCEQYFSAIEYNFRAIFQMSSFVDVPPLLKNWLKALKYLPVVRQ